MEKKAYSIADFLGTHGFSRSALYRLWADGNGPARILVGRKVLITAEAAEEWLKSLQAEDA